MHSIQIADQTFVAAPPECVGKCLEDPSLWRQWWPGLDLEVREARGARGIRWLVTGQVHGAMEVWLKPELDGVLLHFFLHGEPPAGLVGGLGPSRRLGSLLCGLRSRARRALPSRISSGNAQRQPAPLRAGELRRLVSELRLAGKAMSFELKDRCEAGKGPGLAPSPRPAL